jgi:hypothetical protein
MAPPKRANWLDRVIREAKPDRTPKADFNAWRKAHASALRCLTDRGAGVPPRTSPMMMLTRLWSDAARKPIARLAVAAVLIGGVFILAILLIGHEQVSPESSVVDSKQGQRSHPSEVQIAEREIILAKELFTRRDVEKLLSLLENGQPRTAFAVAAYLAQIGDVSSLPALQTLAIQWQGSSQENPFQAAVDEIRRRNGLNDATPPIVPPAPVVIAPLAKEPSPSRNDTQAQVWRGLVRDRAGRPIGGARVWAQSCTKSLKTSNITEPVRADPRGRFSLTVPTEKYDAGDSLYLLCKHPGYALGWIRLPADSTTAEPNDCELILHDPTVVAGTVSDLQGRPVRQALVEARVVPAHNPTIAQEYPYAAGNELAVKTDSEGRFLLDEVPEGSLLSLSVSHRGYGLYDSREGQSRFVGLWSQIDPEFYSVRAGREDVAIQLEPARGTITGRIVDSGGYLHNRELILCCQPLSALRSPLPCRDSQGKCTLLESLPQGIPSISKNGQFTIEDLVSDEYWVAAMDAASGDLVTDVVHATISELHPRDDATLHVSKPVEVTVHVITKAHEPVAGAFVTTGLPKMQKRTDSSGRCVFHLTPGRHTLEICGWTIDSEGTSVIWDESPQYLDRRVDVSPHLRGTLVDESGIPIRGSVSISRGWRVSTDALGRFVIPQPAGDRIGFARDIEGTRACLFWSKRAGGDRDIALQLAPVAIVEGRLVDGDGKAITRGFFRLTAPVEEIRPGGDYFAELYLRALSLAGGRFRFEVPIGLPVALMAESDHRRGRSKAIDPAPGQTYDLGDIILEPFLP